MDEQEMVTITKREYDQLQKESHWLGCLEQAGVDNWCGFDEAREIYREETQETEE